MTTSMLPSMRKLSTQTAPDAVSAEADSFAPAQELPPTGYAIATLADGRFLPLAMIPLACEEALTFALCQFSWQTDPIPLAEGEYCGSGAIICASYQEALWRCERHHETARLLQEARAATLYSECYPERNIWYREETERLLREAGYDWPGLSESDDGDEEKREAEKSGPFCIVEAQDVPRLLAWLEVTAQAEREGSHSGPGTLAAGTDDACAPLLRQRKRACPNLNLHVEAANLDELWERLYDAVRTTIARWHRKEAYEAALLLAKTAS